jgi:hypothetical protein
MRSKEWREEDSKSHKVRQQPAMSMRSVPAHTERERRHGAYAFRRHSVCAPTHTHIQLVVGHVLSWRGMKRREEKGLMARKEEGRKWQGRKRRNGITYTKEEKQLD